MTVNSFPKLRSFHIIEIKETWYSVEQEKQWQNTLVKSLSKNVPVCCSLNLPQIRNGVITGPYHRQSIFFPKKLKKGLTHLPALKQTLCCVSTLCVQPKGDGKGKESRKQCAEFNVVTSECCVVLDSE